MAVAVSLWHIFLVLSLLALNFIGDGLRDAFDPKAHAETLACRARHWDREMARRR